ncbi:MAG: hypothetical protein K9M99_07710 [Candidatus Cloacimonetes bacterium]|nr:hypothetical protein [Candidatus Cloacimonadota bacterium]
MKQIAILIIIILFSVSGLQGFFRDFAENPADIGDRTSGDVILPVFYFQGGFANNNLSMSDMNMFEEDHVLTDSEKDLLSSSDLNFTGYGKINLLAFGFKNWEIGINSHIRGNLSDFDQEFMEIVLTGNSAESYQTTALSDSYMYQFIKINFDWAYPQGLNLASLPVVRISNKESGGFVLGLEEVLNYMREMDIYLGARVNYYNSSGYAEVLESSQNFTTSEDSLYVDNHFKAVYTGTDTLNMGGNNAFGFGLGLKCELPDGWFYFSVDDLGAQLTYSDLHYNEYINNHIDYLDFIDEDHQEIDGSETVENEKYDEDVILKLDPSITVGAEYNLGKGFDVMAKYRSCDYRLDGFFLGTTYRPVEWFPLKLTYGNGDVDSYAFKFGFDTESFEIMFGMTSYNGLFNGAKGYGGDFGIKFKF